MHIKVIARYIVSYLKKDWNIKNYPIQVYVNSNAREKNVAYGARILNWSGMVGHGETKEAALECLKNKFDLYKVNNTELPRPGCAIPLKFASTEKIDKYEEFAVEFFEKVFHQNYFDGFYSDESSFTYMELMVDEEITNPREMIIQRIKFIYNTDISGVYDEPIWKVFQLLSDKAIM